MAYTEAQKRANLKYLKEKTDDIRIRSGKGIKDRWKAAADKQGVSLNRYVIDAVEDRIARESAAEAAALWEVVTALAEAHSKPYTVTYRVAEQFPSGTVKVAPADAQTVVEASSEDEARVAFFRFVKDQMDAEVAFEESDKLGVKRDDGVIEICKIVSVEAN